MKKLFKTLAVLAAVAALGFGFVSCGDSGDDNNGNSGNNNTNPAQTGTALAIFTCNSGYDTRTLSFYEDSTFEVIVSDETGSQAEGTYTFDSGDWENGTITLTATSGYKQDTFTGTKTISEKKITFSTKTYTLTGGTLKTPAKDNENNNSGNSGTTNTDTTKTDSTETDTTKTDTPATTSIAIFKTYYDYEISFAADDTYLIKNKYGKNEEKGTYTLEGDFSNGSITMKETHYWSSYDDTWKESTYTYSFKIENGVGTSDSYNVSYNVLTALAVYKYSGSSKELVIFSEDSTFKLLKYGECETDGKYKLDSGDWENGTIILFDKKPYKKSGIYTISEKKLDLGLTYSLKDGTLKTPTSSETDSSVAFSGTDDLYGKKYLFKFSNGNYVQWVDGKESEKGTYTMAGDFTNGFMKLIKTHQYANDSWETTEENIIKCEIRDGTLSLGGRVKYETVSYDYDVTDDLPKIRIKFYIVKDLTNEYDCEIVEQFVKPGSKAEKPTAPTMENCEFVGWYIYEGWDNDDFKKIYSSEPFDFDTPITKEIELYSKWHTSLKAFYKSDDSDILIRFYTDKTYKKITDETNIETGTYKIEPMQYAAYNSETGEDEIKDKEYATYNDMWKDGFIIFTPSEGESYDGWLEYDEYHGSVHYKLSYSYNDNSRLFYCYADDHWFNGKHLWSNETEE